MTHRTLVSAALAAVITAAGPAKADHVPGHTGNGPVIVPNQPQDLVLENRDLVIEDQAGNVRVRIDATTGSYFGNTANERRAFHVDQPGANLFLGGSGSPQSNDDGDILLFSETATSQDSNTASIHLDGGRGVILLGGGGEVGQMTLRTAGGAQRVLLDAEDAMMILGNGNPGGHDGRLILRDANGDNTAEIDGGSGRITAGRIVSRASGQGGSQGIDSASVFVRSANPSLALLDTTGGNDDGWYVQAGSGGNLLFQSGTPSGLNRTVMTLHTDGSVCLGACN